MADSVSTDFRDIKEVRSALDKGPNMIIQATPTNSNNLDITDKEAAIMSNRYYISQASLKGKDKRSEFQALQDLTLQLKKTLEDTSNVGGDKEIQITLLQEILNTLESKVTVDESVVVKEK